MKLETLAIHAGNAVDPATGAIAPPLHLSTTFEHAPDGRLPHGLIYQRYDNPTQQRLETALASLDGARHALFFGSGMAAASALLQALPAGSEVLLQDDLYHGTHELARDLFPRWGLRARVVDSGNLAAVRDALSPATRLLWIETPSNPLLNVVDIEALAALTQRAGVLLLVDGTFATPLLQRPLLLGADIVLHSATKYLGGHSDAMGGVLSFREDTDLTRRCFDLRALLGHHASPFAAWLTLRGLKTLACRMQVHCANARQIATFLAGQQAVERVHFPGLIDHPGHAVAARQMRDFGGMLSLQLRGGRAAALAVAGRLKLIVNATSLGGCESLIEHRASVEGKLPRSPDNLLRLSVGLEHADDLIADLQQALMGC